MIRPRPRARASRDLHKGKALRAAHGRMCRKTMIGGGVVRQLGWHVRPPCSAHLCHHFPHGLRRCGVVGSTSLRHSVLFGDDDAGARERGHLFENGARCGWEQARGKRRACLALQQKARCRNENWGTAGSERPLFAQGSSQLLHAQICRNRSPTASGQFF